MEEKRRRRRTKKKKKNNNNNLSPSLSSDPRGTAPAGDARRTPSEKSPGRPLLRMASCRAGYPPPPPDSAAGSARCQSSQRRPGGGDRSALSVNPSLVMRLTISCNQNAPNIFTKRKLKPKYIVWVNSENKKIL